MCGIHGIISNDTYVHYSDDFMESAFIANMLRGQHASGIFQVQNNYDVRTFKKAMHGLDFTKEGETKAILTAVPRSRATIGHVRHATAGKSDVDANAHPFVVKRDDDSKIIGVHNGSLKNWKSKKDSKDIDVDSAWAFQMLAAENADAFEYFNGAFCFVWYDTADKDTLYVARNDERPFHIMMAQDGKSMLMASELGMLGWLAERHKMKAKKFKGYDTPFLSISPGAIHKFDLKNIGEWDQVEFPKYDPQTTIVVPSNIAVQNHNLYPTSGHPSARNRDYSNVQGMYDDQDWGGEGEFFGDGMPWRGSSPGWNQRNDHDYEKWDRERAEKFFEGVKSVLKKYRDQREGVVVDREPKDDNHVDMTALETAIEEAVAEWNKEKADKEGGAGDGVSFLGLSLLKPEASKCTRGEQQLAKEQGIFGLVVPFTGIMHDDELAECLGITRVTIDGVERTDFDATIRGSTERVSKHRYINPTVRKPREMVVIGYHADGPNPHVILEEIPAANREFMKASRSHKVVVH